MLMKACAVPQERASTETPVYDGQVLQPAHAPAQKLSVANASWRSTTSLAKCAHASNSLIFMAEVGEFLDAEARSCLWPAFFGPPWPLGGQPLGSRARPGGSFALLGTAGASTQSRSGPCRSTCTQGLEEMRGAPGFGAASRCADHPCSGGRFGAVDLGWHSALSGGEVHAS